MMLWIGGDVPPTAKVSEMHLRKWRDYYALVQTQFKLKFADRSFEEVPARPTCLMRHVVLVDRWAQPRGIRCVTVSLRISRSKLHNHIRHSRPLCGLDLFSVRALMQNPFIVGQVSIFCEFFVCFLFLDRSLHMSGRFSYPPSSILQFVFLCRCLVRQKYCLHAASEMCQALAR